MSENNLRTCTGPGCTIRIGRELAFCRRHWYALPSDMRSSIWREYRRGQGSREHLAALAAAERWLHVHAKGAR